MGEAGHYCLVLQEASFQESAGHGQINIERIQLNEMGQEAIRLSYSERNSQGHYQVAARPLEAIEDDIFELIKRGIEKRIISPILQAGLKTVIRSTELPPVPSKPIKTNEYFDLYARGEISACDHTIGMERIFIKALNRFTIRLAFYRENENGVQAMALTAADMSEEEFLYLFQDAMKNGVYSKVFSIALLSLL